MTFLTFPAGNQKGLSIVEGLVATAIVAVAAAATSGLVLYVGKQSRRAQTLNRAISVQSALVSALLNKAQYAKDGAPADRLQALAQMAATQDPVGFKIYSDPVNQKGLLAVVGVGQRVGYSIDGADASSAKDCPAAGCPIAVDLNFKCDNLATAGCAVAYRVTIMPVAGEVTPAPLGAPTGSATSPVDFAPSDYTLQLSYDFFTQAPNADCSYDPENILITGVNRTNGKVTCVAKQADTCPAGTVAHAVMLENDLTSGKPRLKLQCHPLSQVQCPTDYVLQKFDFSQLDGGQGSPGGVMPNLGGTCVYRWKTGIPWQGPTFRTATTASTATYSAIVCNTQFYDAVASGGCGVAWDSNPPLYCPNTCPDFDDEGKQIGSHDCSYSVQATAGVSTAGPTSGANVATCTVNVQQQTCSGGTTAATAHGVWGGTCNVRPSVLTNGSFTAPPTNGGHY